MIHSTTHSFNSCPAQEQKPRMSFAAPSGVLGLDFPYVIDASSPNFFGKGVSTKGFKTAESFYGYVDAVRAQGRIVNVHTDNFPVFAQIEPRTVTAVSSVLFDEQTTSQVPNVRFLSLTDSCSTTALRAKRAPRTVTRGETSQVHQTIVDYLNFTFKLQPTDDETIPFSVPELIETFSEILGRPVSALNAEKGLHGYKHSLTFFAHIGSQKQTFCIVAWGGVAQCGSCLVSISGTGCALVDDWQAVKNLIADLKGKITRLDLALDFLNGEYTVENAVDFYQNGLFTLTNPPAVSQAGDWINNQARTLYIGKAKNGKLCRVYEKGHQLGDLQSNWVRFEVQFGSRDRLIPLEALTTRDDYFAGAYPAFADLIGVIGERIKTQTKEAEITVAHLIKHMRSAYGKALYCAMQMHGFQIESLVEDVAVIGTPRRVKASGLESGATWSSVRDYIRKT